MPQVIVVLGVILELAFLVFAIYKGVSPVLASLFSVFVVILTSGQPFL